MPRQKNLLGCVKLNNKWLKNIFPFHPHSYHSHEHIRVYPLFYPRPFGSDKKIKKKNCFAPRNVVYTNLSIFRPPFLHARIHARKKIAYNKTKEKNLNIKLEK